MNINTNTLLTARLNKSDSIVKTDVGQLSNDLKEKSSVVNNSSNTENKTIKTLLSELFKEISTQNKTKSEVVDVLEKNKGTLKFKNITMDIKQILNTIKTETKASPELEKFSKVLKNSLVDIKNINEKVVKNSFQNSGVFLESKIIKANDSVKVNLSTLTNQFTDALKVVKSINNNTINNNLKNEIVLAKNVSKDVVSKIEQDVQNILTKTKSVQGLDTKIETKLETLKNVLVDIKGLEQKFEKLGIKNELPINLKEVVSQVKVNILSNIIQNSTQIITNIKEQLEDIPSNSDEIKKDIKNIENKINVISLQKEISSKEAPLKELISQTTKITEKLVMLNNQDLIKINMNNLKNISGDIKTALLQIQEYSSTKEGLETLPKEFKSNIEKLLSQIDYFQLSSFSSNSNHSYISFLQDDLEDMDIKITSDKKDEFSCLINLSLKENGDLKILLQLEKQNTLSINIGVEKHEFKNKIQNELQELRKRINSIGLSVLNLNIFNLDESNESNQRIQAFTSNSDIDFGLDLKV